jgi:hypothetical protein
MNTRERTGTRTEVLTDSAGFTAKGFWPAASRFGAERPADEPALAFARNRHATHFS